ncbi:MAG: hypothetical protein KY455_09545 [Euryarchaeota archaeon]|nr:hypothetical protein [Euryarchaeota archaeon]
MALPFAAASEVKWEFTDNTEGKPDGADFTLEDSTGSGSTATVPVPAGGSIVWATDVPADITLDMSGDWTVNIRWTSNLQQVGPDEVAVELGVVTGGAFTAMSGIAKPPGSATDFTVSVTDYIVNAGDHFAVNVTNEDLLTGMFVTVTASGSQTAASFVQTPTGSPNFPVPEFASVALLGVGIILTAGMVKHRRNKSS